MQKIPVSQYYWFGTCLRYLQDANTRQALKTDGGILSNINNFLASLDELGLTVTRRVSEFRLSNFQTELNEDEELSELKAKELREIMTEIRVTLDAEIEGLETYSPTPKRINIEYLLNDVGKLFAPNSYNSLPDIARYDFAEAGKCIAFELPTSAAFHVLRGTESVVRWYYENMVRQQRIKSLNWGPIVEDLRKRKTTKKNEILNNHLDNIRRSFRNPTQHPEATYDIQEVQDLWSVCIDVVNKMSKAIQEKK